MRAGVKIAVVDEGFYFQIYCAGASKQCVLHAGGVFAVLHPDALLKQGLGNGELPHRRGAIEAKTFDIQIAFWLDGAAFPTIRGEGVIAAVVARCFVNPGNQLHALHWWVESGHQQAVIAARKISAHGAGSKSSKSVSDEPLALLDDFEHATNFPSESDFRLRSQEIVW